MERDLDFEVREFALLQAVGIIAKLSSPRDTLGGPIDDMRLRIEYVKQAQELGNETEVMRRAQALVEEGLVSHVSIFLFGDLATCQVGAELEKLDILKIHYYN